MAPSEAGPLTWVRQGGRRSRLNAVAAGLAAATLAGWALTPVPVPGPADVAALEPVPAAQAPQRQLPAGVDNAPGGAAPRSMAVGAAGSTPSRPGAQSGAASTAVPGRAPAAGGALAPPGAPVQPEVRLSATDRGVSARSIKLGFTIANVSELNDTGLVLGGRTDTDRAIDAFLRQINRAGGIHGRSVEAVKVRVNPLDQSDMRAKCLQLTQDHEVFAVIDTATILYPSTQACFTIETKTPFIHYDALTTAFMRQGTPYDVTYFKDNNRTIVDWVFAAQAAGFFRSDRGFRKLGVLSDGCTPDLYDDPRTGLFALLRSAGVPRGAISDFRVSCDPGQAQGQISQGVLRHSGDGVSHVFLATFWPFGQTYMQVAESQRYRPRYYASDYNGYTFDFFSKSFPPDQWDRVRAITVSHSGERAAGRPLDPATVACSRTLTDSGMPPITGFNADWEVVAFCDGISLAARMATAAGPQLTRVGFSNAITQVGDFRGGLVELSRYGPLGKVSGGDVIAEIEWRRECRCWVQISRFRRAYG